MDHLQRRFHITVPIALGLSLILAACGQTPPDVAADPYAGGAEHSWSYTRPAGQLNALRLTPGVNTLYYEPILAATNGWGPIEIDRSNGEQASGDGRPLTLNGKTYTRGFGTHAGSELRYSLLGSGAFCTRLNVDIGVDDEVGSRGSVVFQVFLDGRKAFDSGVMTGASATRSAEVDITGARELRMVVTDAGDGKHYDHADWANPRITCSAGSAPASGTADPSFGTGGVIDSGGADAQLEPGNSVVVADSAGGNFVIRRIFPDGSTQQVTTDLGSNDTARAIARQADGKLVLAGQSGTSFALARYNTDLSLDTTFGTGGKVITDIRSQGFATAYAVTIQPDGKIVAAGSSTQPVGDPSLGRRTAPDVTLVRLLPNGRPDSGFGTDGVVLQDFTFAFPAPDPNFSSEEAYSVLVQADGRIVIAGIAFADGGAVARWGLLSRFNVNGSLDTSFGPVLVRGETGYARLSAIAVDASGQLIVVGATGRYDENGLVQRYGTDGRLQAQTSIRFTSSTGFDTSRLSDVQVQSGGKIVVSGVSFEGQNDVMALARFDANLGLDPTFAQGGKLITSIPARSNSDSSLLPIPEGALLLQSDGKVVLIAQKTARFFP